MRVCEELVARTFQISSDTDPNKLYTVYLGYSVAQRPFCSCLGFTNVLPDFTGVKRCKHVRRMEAGRCTYSEKLDGPPRPSGRCPKCGKTTVEAPLLS